MKLPRRNFLHLAAGAAALPTGGVHTWHKVDLAGPCAVGLRRPVNSSSEGGERCFAPSFTLTALSVVPENKLRLCHDRDELTIRRCDTRLPHHRSPPAMQGRRFADNPTADGCGAYEVGFAFDRGGTAPIGQVCERSKRT